MNDHLTAFIEGLVAKPLFVGEVKVGADLFAGVHIACFWGTVSDTICGLPIFE